MTENQAPDPAQTLVMVPREPTPEMLATLDSSAGDTITDPRAFAQAVWHDMLAAAPAIPAPEGAQEDERAAFEAWALPFLADLKEALSRECYPDGGYDYALTQRMWEAWQARAALAAPAPQAAPVAEVHENGGQKWARLLADLPPGTMLYAQPVQPSVEQWLPIETAPKDFVTEFDGWNGGRVPNVFWARPEYAAKGEYAWCVSEYVTNHGYENVRVKGLTHWMPLPAAPQTKEPTNDR